MWFMEVACPNTCLADCESRVKILLEHVYRDKSFTLDIYMIVLCVKLCEDKR